MYVQIPEGAQSLAFETTDCFKKNNADPNNDFGVYIKLTIVPLKFHTKIEGKLDLDKFDIVPSYIQKFDCAGPDLYSKKKIHLSCHVLPDVLTDRCKVKFKLSAGPYNGGHDHLFSQETEPDGISRYYFGELLNDKDIKLSQDSFINIPKEGLDIFFRAPDFSGQVKLKYEVQDILGNSVAEDEVLISVKANETFVPISVNGLTFTNLISHPSGKYGTQLLVQKLISAQQKYIANAIKAGVPKIFITDLTSQAGSLPWGGLYDIDKDFQPPHCAHRDGQTIDISLSEIKSNVFAEELMLALKNALLSVGLNMKVVGERPQESGSNHWHAQYN